MLRNIGFTVRNNMTIYKVSFFIKSYYRVEVLYDSNIISYELM